MAQPKINGNTVAVAVAAFGMIGWLIALAGEDVVASFMCYASA
jgi:hypothetical protein